MTIFSDNFPILGGLSLGIQCFQFGFILLFGVQSRLRCRSNCLLAMVVAQDELRYLGLGLRVSLSSPFLALLLARGSGVYSMYIPGEIQDTGYIEASTQ